jgi:LPS sulfotransferase NodH
MNGRTNAEFTRAFNAGIDFFIKRNMKVNILRLDNENKENLISICDTRDIKHELVPAHNHRANKAERAIQTWKAHKILTFAAADPQCPKRAYKYFNEQCELTLNLLRGSAATPFISA